MNVPNLTVQVEIVNESELRDLIAQDISVLEAGLVLLKKEQFIPNSLGTRGFIDLYAKDSRGHHVLIELKKTDAAAREAPHEIHKYVEGVKRHLGARDDEIRVIVASTAWRELLVSFSRIVADTKLDITGLQIDVDESSGKISSSIVAPLPFSKGRFIAPWHEVNWHLDEDSLDRGVASIKACCAEKGIQDFVIVVLQPPEPRHSEHQESMWVTLQKMAQLQGNSRTQSRELPKYKYISYFALQMLTVSQCFEILQGNEEEVNELRESTLDLDEEEALLELHEHVSALEPRPTQDHLEIGNPAKFTKFIEAYGCSVLGIHRHGIFQRNSVLDDEEILSELRGEDGATGQRFKRTLQASSRSHMASARSDIAACLSQNQVWRAHIHRALDEIESEFRGSTVDISIFNPSTGVLTPCMAATKENGRLYVPTYSLIVKNPNPIRIYFGGIQANGSALTFKEILRKYYNGDLFQFLLATNWGGYESRDLEIIEDMGGAYRSFRCDIDGPKRNLFALRDDRWRPSAPTDVISLFNDYLKKNEKLLRQIVGKISPRMRDGTCDASSVELHLDKIADIDTGKRLNNFYAEAVDECDVCEWPLAEDKYMVDGKMREGTTRVHMCADCFGFRGEGVGADVGQLYLKQDGRWLQVAGFAHDDTNDGS